MAWLWDSLEEFVGFVQPVRLNSKGEFRLLQCDTTAENERRLFETVKKLSDTLAELKKRGFEGGSQLPATGSESAEEARELAEMAVYSGERLLLLNKRLAMSEVASGFLSQHDMLSQWQRYSKSKRILIEVNRLVEDAGRLLDGHHEIVRFHEKFLIYDLDLPSDLESDFRLARNLFSVGFEETGVFVASRGLESVLKRIADTKGLWTERKRKSKSEVTLYDLVEALHQARWKGRNERLITKETKALLGFLRSIRNRSAHTGEDLQPILGHRETALTIARTASRLWNLIGKSDVELEKGSLGEQ